MREVAKLPQALCDEQIIFVFQHWSSLRLGFCRPDLAAQLQRFFMLEPPRRGLAFHLRTAALLAHSSRQSCQLVLACIRAASSIQWHRSLLVGSTVVKMTDQPILNLGLYQIEIQLDALTRPIGVPGH